MSNKTIITLHQLEELFAKHLEKETGRVVRPEFPRELAPAYFKWCKRNWGAWEQQRDIRRQQLAILEISETHEIDFYIKSAPIRPF